MSTTHRLMAPAALALAMLAYAPTALAETIGTACLDAKGRIIYRLSPYRSAPRPACRSGDQRVRFSLHQPNTSFAKRRVSSEDPGLVPDFGRGAMAVFGTQGQNDLVIILEFPADPPLTPGHCALIAWDLTDDFVHVIASVPPGSFQEGLGEVTVIDVQDEDVVVQSYQATKTVFTHQGALVFHDLIVDHGGARSLSSKPLGSGEGPCFASFLVEYAPDPRQLYAR